MSKLERQIAKLDQREATLHGDLASAAETMDTEKLSSLDLELRDVIAEKELIEERWMELGEKAEG